MVAVISGNGLGLWGTSLQQLGLSPGGQSGLGQSGASQYVNLATGNLVLQSRDEDLVAQGFLAGLVRTYNSLGSTGDYGTGSWLLGLDRSLGSLTGSLNIAGSTITRSDGDGAIKVFTYDATRGLYVAANESGAEDTLAWNAATSTWTYTAGGSLDEETYNASGQLLALRDGKSGATYTLTYNASNQLIAVTASDGEALELGYDAQGRIATLSTLQVPAGGGTAVTESRVSYAYDSLGRLSSVTADLTPDNSSDASSFTTTYTYDGTSNRVASLTQSDGLVVSYTYAQDGSGVYRVATVTTGTSADGDAQTLTFIYNTNGTTTVTDASGRAWVYGYDASDNLTSVTSPLNQVTSYTYTPDGHLASVTDAAGNATIYEYDAHGNRILQRDADGNTTTWTYNTDDQVLTRTVYRTPDPDGSDPANAGAASDPSTTWYVYANGNDGRADQLRYVIDADGDVSETQYNANGQVSLTRSFAGAAYDTSALNPTTAPTLAAMNTWAASQDLTRTTRVDYAYDPSGRLTGKTAWDQVNSSGAGIADAGEAITQYVYDAQGLLRQQVTERGANRTIQDTTSYSYDGLGRLTGSTDAAGNTTTYVYTGGGTLTVTQANGLVHTEVRNSAGEFVTVTESATGQATRTTNYFYDEDGQLRASEDPSGAVTYTFYDAAGRISGTVNATGAVTQYTRDADGNVVETRQYATTVSTAGWLSNGSVASMPSNVAAIPGLATSSSDRVSLSLYDAAGLHVADVDAEGNVTTYGYDGAGNPTVVTQYATALSSGQLNALQGTPSWSTLQTDLGSITSAADRITRTFYDVANRAVAVLDAAGYVTTTAYDAAGRIVKTTAYANGLTAAQITALGHTPSLSAVLADVTSSANDQVTRNYYDDRGQRIAQVDADGYLTTTAYDETTHTATATRYAQALTPTQLQALTGNETLATLTGYMAGSTSQTSAQQYDADGRLLSSTAVDGTVTAYSYNAAGNLVGTTTTPPSGAGAVRSTSATYDAFGDALTATDGANATTTNVYNLLGQKVQVTDALGNSTWFFYDTDGRLAYTVKGIANGTTQNALGEVTAYAYDAFSDVTTTTRYAGRLDLTTLGLTSSTTLTALASAVQAIAGTGANPDASTSYSYTLDGLTASIKDGLGYTTARSYDAFGDLTSVQQQLSGAGQALSAGNSTTTTYTYDARGERLGEIDDAGGLNRSSAVTYDAIGRVISRTDGNGNVTTYGYDPLGRQISVSETVQGTVRTTQTVYDAYHRTVSQTDAMGQTTVYQYSADMHSVTVTTPDGVKLTTTKDAYGDTVAVTDSLGNTTRYTYDGDGRLLTTTDALGYTTTDAYDADGDLIKSTDANGVVTAYTYDAAGRVLTKTLDPTGNDFITAYTWDGRGQQLSMTDPGGVVTTYAHDADGNTLSVIEDAGSGTLNLTTTYTWDGAGHQLSVTQGSGTAAARTTQYTYDNLGRLTQTVVDPGTGHLNLTTIYAYDANDNLVAKTDANGNVTRYVYDEANAQVYAIDASGGVTETWRDADGRVTETRRYATALSANQLAALGTAPGYAQVATQLTTSASDQVSYTVYNNDGEVVYTIDAQGYVTLTRHDQNGRILEVLAYANAITPDAQLVSELQQGTAYNDVTAAIGDYTDHNAQTTLYLRDADGQVRFVVKQDTINGQRLGMVSEQRYDADGRVIASLDYGTPLVLNDSTDWLYDQLSTSSVAQTLAGTTNVHATYYVYSNVGTLSFIIDPDNYVTQKNYDKSGNLTSEHRWLTAITLPATLTAAAVSAAVSTANAASNARLTAYVYDRASRLVQVSDNLGVNATYTYDATGLKLSYANRDGATWTYAYDKAGHLVTQISPQVQVSSYTSGNTIATGAASIVTQFTYDADGNVLSKTEAAGTTVARTTTYAYDSRGNQIRITYPGGSYSSVTYDALGHAVVNRDVNGHYEYKAYNADGELAYDIDGNGYVTAYVYDAYGNQTQITRYATALSTSLTNAGQPLSLAQVQSAIANSSSDRTLTTSYDQLNRKLMVEQPAFAFVSDTGVAGGGSASPTTSYAYDAYGNVVSTSVLVAPGIPGQYAPTWATTYDYFDALGQKTLEVYPMGYVTTWAYDAQGNVTGTTQYAKAISTSGLNTLTPPGLPIAGDAASGFNRVTTFTYDAIGRKTSETDTGDYSSYVSGAQSIASGTRTTSWTYDGENRITSITVNGAKTTTTYDALGRVTSVLEPIRPVLLSNWQALLEANPTQDLTWASLYEPGAPLTLMTYDALGNALSTTRYIGASAAGGSQVSYSHYDALGRVISETDAAGTAYSHTYDNAGNLLSTSYTLIGNSGSSTVTTTYTYDADNQRLSAVTKRGAASDNATYVKYDAFGEIVAKGDGVVNAYSSTGYELTYQYDNAGNLIAAIDPKTGAQHSYQYDLRGNLVYDTTAVTGGAASAYVENQYDADGRLVSQTTPSSTGVNGEGRAVVRAYDRWNNVLSTTDARGYVTTYEYDSQNHLIKQVEPEVLVAAENGARTWQTPTKEWYYDLNGNAVGVTDENGNTTLNAYDVAGELTATTDAVGAVTRYAYDGLGNQVAKQSPITSTTSHITWQSFDALGQVTAQGDFTLNGSTLVQNTQQTYALDQNGNRIRVTDAMANTSYYAYDSQGRLLSSQTPLQHAAAKSDSYTYDVNGNKIKATDADGNTQTWSYDYYGRVRAHTDLSGANYTYAYDASSGLLTAETSGWNPASQGQSDPGYVPPSNGTGSSSETYTYYADGQAAGITQKTGTQTTTTTSYQYDAAGNTTDENVHTYDGAGGVVATDTTSSWDSHNRLSEVTETDSGTGILRTAYNYDADGNRRAVFVQSGYGGSPINSGSGGPTASSIGTQTVQPGGSWSLDAASSFTDTLGFGLTFAATQANGAALPSWMHFDSSGTLSTSGAQLAAGSWSVKMVGTDVDGNTASVTFTVTVPVVNPVFPGFTPPAANTGVPVSFSIPAATDANGSPITYVASYYNGSAWTNTLPSWISFNAGTMTWSGTPPAGSAGTYKLAVSAYAANGGSAPLIFNFVVNASPPVYHNNLANQTGFGTRAFSYTVPAGAFTEVDGSALTYSAGSYSAGSESALPSWLTFNAATQTFSGTPPQSVVGQAFTLYVKATNPSGQIAEGTFTLSVQQYVQPAPVYHGTLTNHSGVLGQSLNLPLPSGAYTEPDGGALTYTAYVLIPEHTLSYWNSSHTEPLDRDIAAQWVALSDVGLSINATNGTITGAPTTLDYVVDELISPYGYEHDTSYQIEVVATNGQSETAAGTFTLSNSYAPPVLQSAIPAVALNPNPPPWGADTVKAVPDNAFSNPYGDNTYTAAMADGSTPPSGLELGGQYVTVEEVPAGTYTIKVTATNKGGSASATYVLTVNNVAPTFAVAPSNLTAVKGSAMAAYVAPTGSDLNTDTLTYSASGMPPGIVFNASTRTFSGTPTATGTWTVSYYATDPHGASVRTTFTIAVSAPTNLPPVYNGGIPSEVDLYAAQGKTDSYTFPSTAFTSPAGEALTYTALQSSGAALPSFLTFNGATRTFTASAVPHDRQSTITIKATDTQGRSVSDTFVFYMDGYVINNNAVPAGGTLATQGTASPDTITATDGTQATEQATQQTATTPNIQSYWFTYDADNRVDIDGGDLVSGQIQVVARTGSVEHEYNQAGEFVTELSNGGPGYGTQTQTFSYDARGNQIGSTLAGGQVETKQYDADGHLIADVYTYAPGTTVRVTNADGTFNMDIGGWLSMATTYYYDADGRVYATFDYGRQNVNWNGIWNKIDNGTLDPSTESAIPASPPSLSDAAGGAAYGVLGLQSHVSHWDPNTGTGGYDAEGNAQVYTYSFYDTSLAQWHTTTYRVSYLKQGGYLEQATAGTSDDPNVLATTDTSLYDAFGRRIAIDTHSAGQTTDPVRAFAYDAEGEILQRRDGSATGSTFTVTANGGYSVEHYAYVQGQQIGNVDEHGTINVLGGVTGFSNSDAGTTNYVAQAGDTMQSIAQQVYGDASLWYVVADANGFSSPTDAPAAGQTLKLPQVTTNSNTANTFKPYNPNEISGSTTPMLPQAPQPPPSAHHCNALAAIIVIAVAVIVSVATYGALAGESATFAESVLAGAAAGAAGSAASQLAGDALGVSKGFDWGQVLVGAVGGAIGGAVASKLAGANAFARGATEGAASYVGTYETEKLVGEPAHFSWAGLVATAVGSGAAAEIGPTAAERKAGITSDTLPEKIEANVVQDVITREVSVGLGDNHVQSWQQIGEDVFGNAFGNAAVGAISEAEWKAAQPSISKQINAAVDNIWGDDSSSPQGINEAAAWQLQEEALQEDPSGPITFPNAELGTGDDTSGLTSDELARLAATTHYSGTYVDPYLIQQNGGNANWAYDVQTFRAPDLGDSVITELPVPAAASVDDSDTDGQNTALRIIGSFIGIGRAAEKTAVGAVTLAGSWVGTGIDDVVGQNGLGLTNYFHADATAFQNAFDNTAQFLSNHPVATALNAWNTALNRAAELSTSSNAADQIESGDILGQLSFNTVMAADGAAGLGKMGLSGASLVADGVGGLTETLSQVRFAGSADSYAGFAPQIGAVGDLSGFKPNIGGSLDVGDASLVQPLGAIEDSEVAAETTPTATQLRNTPGVVTISGELTPASGNWLGAAQPVPVPSQVGDALVGKSFNSFDDLRGAIWQEIASNGELNSSFSAINQGLMSDGYAPFAPQAFQIGDYRAGQVYNLHHIEFISDGGSVYDLSNLQIVSPKIHFDIHRLPQE